MGDPEPDVVIDIPVLRMPPARKALGLDRSERP